MPDLNPYAALEGTPQWVSVDQAVNELAQNRDLVETTAHEYIVGYICKALTGATNGAPSEKIQPGSAKVSQESLAAVREAVRHANTANRDLVQELITERQAEAQRG